MARSSQLFPTMNAADTWRTACPRSLKICARRVGKVLVCAGGTESITAAERKMQIQVLLSAVAASRHRERLHQFPRIDPPGNTRVIHPPERLHAKLSQNYAPR
jgi:hypothetical protein